MMVGMLRPSFAAPSPEITSLQRRRRADAVEHGRIDQLIEAVLEARRRARFETAAIARESEFLDHQRLVELARDPDLLRNIIAGVPFDGRPSAREILWVCPAPILRPHMRVDVVNRG